MKYAIGIVLYNPNLEQLTNISKIISSQLFDLAIVYDNSPTSSSEYFGTDCRYLFNGINDGLAVAYNKFIEIGIQSSIDYLCLGDQDSNYEIEEIQKMQEFIDSDFMFLRDTAIIGPRSYADVSKRILRSHRTTETLYIINSGSFLNIMLLQDLGLRYDENLFIDGIDYEFGLAIKRKGYKVKIYEDSVLEQPLGYTRVRFGKPYCCHSAFRYYHISKARRIIYMKYRGKIKGWVQSFIINIGALIKILIFEDNKLRKVLQCIKGQFASYLH